MTRPLGITSLSILAEIDAGSAYGLDIVTRTGLVSGTVYPTLGRLKRSGLVRTRWEDQRTADREGRTRRKYYDLTAEGRLVLTEQSARVRELARRLDGPVPGEVG